MIKTENEEARIIETPHIHVYGILIMLKKKINPFISHITLWIFCWHGLIN